MTDFEGNRLSICPLRFRIASTKIAIDLVCALVSRNSWGGDSESLRANRSTYYPRNQSLFVFKYYYYYYLLLAVLVIALYGHKGLCYMTGEEAIMAHGL